MNYRRASILVEKMSRTTPVFRKSDLRILFNEETDRTFLDTLERLNDGHALMRISPGVYAHPGHLSRCGSPIEEAAAVMRRGFHTYISLESALSEHGIISQIPTGWLTLMTTGRKGAFETPLGGVEFIHTSRPPAQIHAGASARPGHPLPIATPDMALEDLSRVGRNMHLVDHDMVAEIEAEKDDDPQFP